MATAIMDLPAPFDVSFDFYDDYPCVGSMCVFVEDISGAPVVPGDIEDGTKEQFFEWFDDTFGGEDDHDDPWAALRERIASCRNYVCDCSSFAWESDRDYFDELLAGFDQTVAFKHERRYDGCEQIRVPVTVDKAHQMSSSRPDGWERLEMVWDGDTLTLTFSGSSGRWDFECSPFDPDRSRLAELDDSYADWPRSQCPAERVNAMTREQAKLALAYLDLYEQDRTDERPILEDVVDQVAVLFADATALQVAAGIVEGWNSDLEDLASAVSAVLSGP